MTFKFSQHTEDPKWLEVKDEFLDLWIGEISPEPKFYCETGAYSLQELRQVVAKLEELSTPEQLGA